MNLSTPLDRIIYLIKENENLLSTFTEVYIFGSAINNFKYNDIDILLIYENFSPELLSNKNKLEYLGENTLDCLLDITMLSRDEEKDVRFLKRLNSKYIRIK